MTIISRYVRGLERIVPHQRHLTTRIVDSRGVQRRVYQYNVGGTTSSPHAKKRTRPTFNDTTTTTTREQQHTRRQSPDYQKTSKQETPKRIFRKDLAQLVANKKLEPPEKTTPRRDRKSRHPPRHDNPSKRYADKRNGFHEKVNVSKPDNRRNSNGLGRRFVDRDSISHRIDHGDATEKADKQRGGRIAGVDDGRRGKSPNHGLGARGGSGDNVDFRKTMRAKEASTLKPSKRRIASKRKGGFTTKGVQLSDNHASPKFHEGVDQKKEEKTTRRPTLRSTRDVIQFSRDSLDVHILSQPGLEPILYHELNSLCIPFTIQPKTPGVNLVNATMDTVHRCQLHLGSARLIQLRLGKPFLVRALGELRRKVSKMPWSDIITAFPQKIRVQASKKSRLLHTAAIENCIRQGIEDSMQDGDYGKDGACCLSALIQDDHLQLSVDTRAEPLHQRMYRLETAKAPLREDLAFALLHASGWNPEQSSFLDPFCGAGTIAIEAASQAMKLAPGRLLTAPLEDTTLYDPHDWTRLVEENQANRVIPDEPRIFASDRDAGAIRAARANAKRAGVTVAVDFQVGSFSSHAKWHDENLFVVSNPPFGKRVKKPVLSELNFYQTLAKKLDHCNGQAMLLSNDTAFWKRAGFNHSFKSALRTWHGGIAVDGMLYQNVREVEEKTVAEEVAE